MKHFKAWIVNLPQRLLAWCFILSIIDDNDATYYTWNTGRRPLGRLTNHAFAQRIHFHHESFCSLFLKGFWCSTLRFSDRLEPLGKGEQNLFMVLLWHLKLHTLVCVQISVFYTYNLFCFLLDTYSSLCFKHSILCKIYWFIFIFFSRREPTLETRVWVALIQVFEHVCSSFAQSCYWKDKGAPCGPSARMSTPNVYKFCACARFSSLQPVEETGFLQNQSDKTRSFGLVRK